MKKNIFIVGFCSAGALAIGYYIGKTSTEEKFEPQINNLADRISYLENGIVM